MSPAGLARSSLYILPGRTGLWGKEADTGRAERAGMAGSSCHLDTEEATEGELAELGPSPAPARTHTAGGAGQGKG